MGFFSTCCKECEHPLLSKPATNEINEWMKRVVVVMPDESILKGEYGGYGNIFGKTGGEYDISDKIDEVTAYHEDCWIAAGKPMEYRGPSKYAIDQGWFFNDEHDVPSPLAESVDQAAAPGR